MGKTKTIKKNWLVFLLVEIFFFTISYSQVPYELKEKIIEADSYFILEEYEEALPIYIKISRELPDNDRNNYKIGVCYLNIEFQKSNAIEYLERAVKNINPEDYKDKNWRETKAPLQAWYRLGNAYRINNQLDKAIKTYRLFLAKIEERQEEYDLELINDEITACLTAKMLMSEPVFVDIKNIGDKINTRAPEKRAVVSADETMIVYTAELKFYDALFYAVKKDGEWSYPINMMPILLVDKDVYPTALSHNGKELYIYRSDNYDGNIYVTNYKNDTWTPLRKLNRNINTKYWESHASVSPDGKTLYFTSNRKGGYGNLDIYQAPRLPDGTWGEPQNLGPTVNSRYNEETPFVSADGNRLYFSSYGHLNMGGYDILYSERDENGKWTKPVNIGHPINTTDNDLFFQPIKNGVFAYYATYKPENSFGYSDIYRYEIFSDANPRKFNILGEIVFPDSLEISTGDMNVYLIDNESHDTIQKITPENDGKYAFETFSGNYEVILKGDKITPQVNSLQLVDNQKNSKIKIISDLTCEIKVEQPKPKSILLADNIECSDSIITLGKDENTAKVKLIFKEKGTVKVVEIANKDTLNVTSKGIHRKRYTHRIIPVFDTTLLVVKHTTGDSAISIQRITVVKNIVDDETDENTSENTQIINPLDKILPDLIASTKNKNLLIAIKNLKETPVYDEKQLYFHLQNKAGKEAVDEMIMTLVKKNEIEEYTSLVRKNANDTIITVINDHLKKLISSENIDSTISLIIEKSINNEAEGDLQLAFAKIISEHSSSPDETLESLENNTNHNDLVQLAKKIFADTPDMKGSLDNIIKAVADDDALKKELTIALAKMTQIINTKNINKALRKLDPEKKIAALHQSNERIQNIADLEKSIDLLIKGGDETSRQQISELLIKYQVERKAFPDYFERELEYLANDEIKKAMQKLREEHIFTNSYQLYNALKSNAVNYGYTEKDLLQIITKMAYKGDPENIKDIEQFLKLLQKNARGNLKKYLATIQLKNVNIASVHDLINHLISNAHQNDYTKNNVIVLLQEIIRINILEQLPIEEYTTDNVNLTVSEQEAKNKKPLWFLLLLGLIPISLLFIFLFKKNQKKSDQ